MSVVLICWFALCCVFFLCCLSCAHHSLLPLSPLSRSLSLYLSSSQKLVQVLLYITTTTGFSFLVTTSTKTTTRMMDIPKQDVGRPTGIRWFLTSASLDAAIVSATTTVVLASLLLSIWTWYLQQQLSQQKIPNYDLAVFTFFVVSCCIFSLSIAPTTYVPELADAILGDTTATWRDTVGVLMVLGVSTLFWLSVYVCAGLSSMFPDGKTRGLITLIFVVLTAAPLSSLVVLAPVGDSTTMGWILLAEVVGPSLYLLAWVDRRIVSVTSTLKSIGARVFVFFLLLFGGVVPLALLINSATWPSPWDRSTTLYFSNITTSTVANITLSVESSSSAANEANVMVPYSLLYSFALGICLFVVIYLCVHETTLATEHDTSGCSVLLCLTTVTAGSIVFGYLLAAHHDPAAQPMGETILLLVPMFVVGGLGYGTAHLRLLDKFASGSLCLVLIPVLLLLSSPDMDSHPVSLFLIVALPVTFFVWFLFAMFHELAPNSFLWAFNFCCFLLLAPVGALLPLLLSTPLVLARQVLQVLMLLFPGVYLVGVGSLWLRRCDAKEEERRRSKNDDGGEEEEVVVPQVPLQCTLTKCRRAGRWMCCSVWSGYWASHVGLVFFVLVAEVMLFRVALPTNRGSLWYLLLSVPIVHIAFMRVTKTSEEQEEQEEEGKVEGRGGGGSKVCFVVLFGIVLPVVVGIIMLAMRSVVREANTAEFLSLALAILCAVPFHTLSWLFLWLVRDSTRSLPDGQAERATSYTTAACCWTVLLPVGALTFVLATDWWSTEFGAATLLVSISVLALMCLGNVSAMTIAVNSTFKSIRRERIAKEMTIAIVQELEDMRVEISTETARLVFDQIGTLTLSEMRVRLENIGTVTSDPSVIDPPDARLLNTLLEEDGIKVLTATEFVQGVETKRIVLCERCLGGSQDTTEMAAYDNDDDDDDHDETKERKRNVRAANLSSLCQACILDDTVKERRRQLEAKRLAEEGDKRMQEELRRERLLKKKLERERKERETKFALSASVDMEKEQWSEAIQHFTNAIESNSNESKYFYQRGLCYLQLASSVSRKSKKAHFASALVDGDRCFLLRPNWTQNFVLRGGALVGLERLDEALQVYTEGLVLAPVCAPLVRGAESTARHLGRGPTFLTATSSSTPLQEKPTMGQFLFGWIAKVSSGVAHHSQPLRDTVERNISELRDLRRRPSSDSEVSTVSMITSRSMSIDSIGGAADGVKKVGQSRVAAMKMFHHKQVMHGQESSRQHALRIQIVDVVLPSSTSTGDTKSKHTPPPRVFVRVTLRHGETTRRKETTPIRALVPSWRDQYFMVRRWMAPPRAAVRISLYQDENGTICELGRVNVFMFQVVRMCRDKAYVHFDMAR